MGLSGATRFGAVSVRAIALLLLVGCAKVGPPSGGPVDKEAPRIVDHSPAADATHTAADQVVEIVFSESMNRQSVEEAIFVAPEVESALGWKGRRLTLSFSQPLQADRTYVVTVGTGARDLRRNGLDRSYTFAFSTGDEINQGSIVGKVFKDHQPIVGAHVWAYDAEQLTGRMGTEAPDYRTQTGKDGAFEFSRLSVTRYRVMAFDDQDRDQAYDSGEPLGLGAGDRLVGEEGETAAGYIAISKPGRADPRLKRVQALHDRVILLEFNQPVDARKATFEVEDLAVAELYTSPTDASKLYAVTGLQEGGREYRVAQLAVSETTIDWHESIRGRGRSDRAAPKVLRDPQARSLGPRDSLTVAFSEAMGAGMPSDLRSLTDSAWTTSGSWSWTGPTTLVFAAKEPIPPGEYSLEAAADELEDRAGNALADSVISIRFTVLDRSAMPTLTGHVPTFADPVFVIARLRPGSRSYKTLASEAGEYELGPMVPGKYDLYGYVDRDGDGHQDFGSVDPYAAGEVYLRSSGRSSGRRSGVVELARDGEKTEIDLHATGGDRACLKE